MGSDTQTNSKIVKMKLFAVLALAVAARQVNQYADNEVALGDACSDGAKDCGTLTECKELKCTCLAGHVQDGETNNCIKEVILDLDATCTPEEKCGNNAECVDDGLRALMCKCKDKFEPITGDKQNCAAPAEGPALDAECTTDGPKCGGNQECKASADDAKIMTCQCLATHEDKAGVCTLLESDGSAAFYSVATAFMALILA